MEKAERLLGLFLCIEFSQNHLVKTTAITFQNSLFTEDIAQKTCNPNINKLHYT
jgi:hypothetical protein